MRKAENPIDPPRGTPWKMQSGERTGTITDRKRMTGKIGGKVAPYPHLRTHVDRITGTGREVSKVNIQEVLFTPADAAEALETIAWLELDERGTIPARLMYNDPHQPPHWWHVRHMLNLTLLARTVAAQEGTAPAPGNPLLITFAEDPVTNGAALIRLKAKLKQWKDGTEPIPPAILPTYEGQTWIDIDRLNYRFDRPAPHPNPEFHRETRWKMQSNLSQLLETIHPTEEVVHGSRCHICYDESDLNIRIAPDYYFAKDVPGRGVIATGVYLQWVVGKPPDFALEMASPDKVREDLIGKRRLYQEIGIKEYWRLDPTGGDLYGTPLAADRLEGGVYEPIPLHRLEKGTVWGHSEATGIDLFWMNEIFVYLGPDTER